MSAFFSGYSANLRAASSKADNFKSELKILNSVSSATKLPLTSCESAPASATLAFSLDSPMRNLLMVAMSRSRSDVKSWTVFNSEVNTMIETESLAVICPVRNLMAALRARICSAGCMDEKSNNITMRRRS